MVRSMLVLAGLLAGVLAVWGWFWFSPVQPLWWWADWRIGVAELILAMTVLVAAHLAAGRPRRDAMADLYASFPATAGTRTLACLAGLAGAVPASVLLAGAAAGLVQLRGATGAPGIMVLAGGVVLVIAAGAAGTALGTENVLSTGTSNESNRSPNPRRIGRSARSINPPFALKPSDSALARS